MPAETIDAIADHYEFRGVVSNRVENPNIAVELLDQAEESKDVIEADGRCWMVRKGKFAYSENDHEMV